VSIVKPIRAGEPASNVSHERLSLRKLKSSVTELSSKLLIIQSVSGRRQTAGTTALCFQIKRRWRFMTNDGRE